MTELVKVFKTKKEAMQKTKKAELFFGKIYKIKPIKMWAVFRYKQM